MKTVSIREMSHDGISKTIRDAQDEPVLVRKGDQPAWIIGAQALQRATAAARQGGDVYENALRLVAADLFDREVLSLGQAARLAGLHLADFIDLCGRLQIPVLRESPEGLVAEVEALEDWLERARLTAGS